MFSISLALGEKTLGVYSISVFFYYLFAFFTSFELTTYFGKEVAFRKDNTNDIKNLVSEIVVTFFMGAVLALFILINILLFYKKIDSSVLIISAVSGIVFGLEKNLSGVLLGREKMQYEFICQILAFGLVAVPVYFFAKKLGVLGVYALRITASVVCIILRAYYTRVLAFWERKRFSFQKYNWKEIKFFYLSGLSIFVYQHIDLYILSLFITKEEEGIYFLALRIFLAFTLLAEMVSFALTPFISRSYRGKDTFGFDTFHKRMLYTQMAAGALAAIILFFSRDLLISFVLKDEPANMASDYLFYFSFMLFFRFVSFYTGNVLTSTKFQNLRFYILITSAILMIMLEGILGKLYLIYGIIAARAVVELFLFIAYLMAIKKIKKKSLNSGV
jgi:O-antigen/teichoic acid export membrane protein